MANNGFHEAQQRKPVLYLIPNTSTNSPTPSTNSTPLKLSPESPTPPQPPLFHVQEQATIFDDDDAYFNKLPPGLRFVPTDEELIVHYLDRKLQNLPLPRNLITEVNLYDHHPEKLAERYKSKIQQNYLYFFTPRDRKYKNGSRPNRAAGNGFWKATGADKSVRHNGTRIEVGFRKSLVYYVGKPPKGQKTNWIMHEFRMKNPPKPVINGSNDMKLDDWVLCRISLKNERNGAKCRRESSVGKQCEDDAEMKTNNNFTALNYPNSGANHSSNLDHASASYQYDTGLLNYPKPPPTSFNPCYNELSNQLGSGSYGNSMMPINPLRPSWICNTAAQENMFPYTGAFDEIDPFSVLDFPPPEFGVNQLVPANSFDNSKVVETPANSDKSEVIEAHFQPPGTPVNSDNSGMVKAHFQPPVQPIKTQK